MNEFERRLQRSLTEVRDAGRLGASARREAVKQELFRRLRRRRLLGFGGNVALAGAVAAALFLTFSLSSADPVTEQPDIAPVRIPPQAVALVDVGDEPRHLSVGGFGYVWSSDSGSHTLTRIHPDRNEVVSSIDLPAAPGDVEIGTGPVWVALPSEGTVVEVDPASRSITQTVPVAAGPVADIELGLGGGALWVVVPEQEVLRIDLVTRERQSVQVSSDPRDVAVKGGIAHILGAEGIVYRLDSLTSKEVGPRLNVPPSTSGDISLRAGSLWYFTGTDGTLIRIDPDTGNTIAEVAIEGDIIDFAADPEVAWALSAADDSYLLTPLDRDRTVVAGPPIEVPGAPTELIIAEGSLWLTLSDEDVVLRFNKFP